MKIYIYIKVNYHLYKKFTSRLITLTNGAFFDAFP